jgi:hypothetical protein
MNCSRVEPLDMIAYQKKTCTWNNPEKDKSEDPHIHTKP